MTYEVYGTGGSDAKIRVEGIAAEVKVAWGVNVVNSNVSYLVFYVDVPYQQGLQIRYTVWDGNNEISRGPTNISPVNSDNYRYNISVYNCNFVTAGYDHSDPQKKVFTANNGNLYYMWTDEMQQQVRTYFDNYVPGQGAGEVTLQTERPSQLLTFTSQKLGQSFKYWIRGNQTIELYKPSDDPDPSPDWEILWMFSFQGTKGIMLIDSNFNCTVYNDLQDITGEIIKYTASTSKASAVQKCAASYGNTGTQLTSGTFNANADISTFSSGLEMMVLAKKNLSAKIPYELGFYWVKPNISASQFCIVKANEASVVTFTGSLLTGDRMTLEYRGIYDKVLSSTYQGATFNGKIKEADLSVTGNWQEIDASSVGSLYGVFGVAIAVLS